MGRLVYCPLHGGAFDITTGLAIAPPCEAPLKLLPLSVAEDAVWLELPEAAETKAQHCPKPPAV